MFRIKKTSLIVCSCARTRQTPPFLIFYALFVSSQSVTLSFLFFHLVYVFVCLFDYAHACFFVFCLVHVAGALAAVLYMLRFSVCFLFVPTSLLIYLIGIFGLRRGNCYGLTVLTLNRYGQCFCFQNEIKYFLDTFIQIFF